MNTTNFGNKPFPIWGALSVAVTPLMVIFAFLSIWVLELFIEKPEPASHSTLFPGYARAVVFIISGCILESVILALIAVLSGEHPRWLPILGLFITASVVGLFLIFK